MDSRLNIYKPIDRKRAVERIILHNTGNSPISKSEFMNELNHYKELSPQCKEFIKRMRNLVSNITIINIKEIRVVCNNCKHFETLKLCKKCNEVIINYILGQENYNLYNELNAEVIRELRSLLGFVEKDNRPMKHKSDSLEELLKMIRIKTRSPHVGHCDYKKNSELEVLKVKSENEDLSTLQEVVCKKSVHSKISLNENLSDENLDYGKSCICKYVAKNISPYNVAGKQSLLSSNLTFHENVIDSKEEAFIDIPNKKVQSRSRLPVMKSKNKEKKNFVKIQKEIKSDEKSVNDNEKENSDTFMQIIMKQRKNHKRDDVYNLKQFERIDVTDLPSLPVKDEKISIESVCEETENTVECEYLKPVQPNEMIKGTRIVHYDPKVTASRNQSLKPLLFEVTHNFTGNAENTVSTHSTNDKEDKLSEDPLKEIKITQNKYQLSNGDYIENGWTILPEYKIKRQIVSDNRDSLPSTIGLDYTASVILPQLNVYKMVPANSTFNWFTKNKHHRQMFYGTGELLADINDGQGRWYYKDGHLALNFCETTERNSNKMYYVYDVVTKNKNKQRMDVPILAYFDYMGLGIVYDRFGNTRLKYNQSEGIVLDDRIGPRAKWKWHTLNDQPNFVGVYQEKYLKPNDKCLDKLTSKNERSNNNIDDKMTEIELNNSVRETLKKFSTKYKPLEIRSKVFKLNDYLSLKILSQSKIYLLFRCGEKSLKLNVGMELITNEIVGVEVIDVAEVVKEIEIRHLDGS